VRISGSTTSFKLWAPTAQKVYVFTYDTPSGNAATVDEMVMDAATGVWSASRNSDLSGKTYRYAVETFVRGEDERLRGPGGATEVEKRRLDLSRKLLSHMEDALKTDPYSWAERTETLRKIAPLDLGSPDAARPQAFEKTQPMVRTPP
jgi:1,4-alpha-glucan branching enzyme